MLIPSPEIAGNGSTVASGRRNGTASTVKPQVLRRALRLIHSLQKERGASCASSVSSGFRSNLLGARRNTNVALRLMGDEHSRPHLRSLHEIRTQLDEQHKSGRTHPKKSSPEEGFHQILLQFNMLIGKVVSTHILVHTERRAAKRHRGHRRHRSLSTEMPSAAILRSTSDPALSSLIFKSSTPTVHFAKNQVGSKIPELLDLLVCEVRLKESTGLERALLSTMLCTGQVHQKLLNDLVLVVENQMHLHSALNQQQVSGDFSPTLLQLIREGVLLPEDFRSLQTQIIQKFDLQVSSAALPQVSDVWNLITVYMDKLYSLELLLMEELECTMEEERRSGSVQAPSHSPTSMKPPLSVRVAPDAADEEGSLQGEFLVEDEVVEEQVAQDNFAGDDEDDGDPSDRQSLLQKLLGSDHMKLEEMPPVIVKERLLQWVSRPPPRRMSSTPTSAEEDSDSSSDGSNVSEAGDAPTAERERNEWDINLYEIQFQKRIGRGTAGTTYLAKWSGQEVAVKVAAITEMGLDGWKTEVKSLQRLHHPNVIRLLGSVYHESPLTYCLVLEYCPAGDLSNALKKPTPKNFWFRVALDMAHGLSYLHSRKLIHRDIKPANVLLDGTVANGTFTAKLADFGLATYSEGGNPTAETGTYRWMAPETIRHEPYSELADVFSLGVVLWQLVTREDPFCDISPIEAAGKVALECARPPFPKGTPQKIADLVKTCWAETPSERPTTSELGEAIQKLDLTKLDRDWMGSTLGHPVYDVVEEDISVAVGEVVKQSVVSPNSRPPLAFVGKRKPTSGLGRKLFGRKSGK